MWQNYKLNLPLFLAIAGSLVEVDPSGGGNPNDIDKFSVTYHKGYSSGKPLDTIIKVEYSIRTVLGNFQRISIMSGVGVLD